jgi:peptidylprolyl isomerase
VKRYAAVSLLCIAVALAGCGGEDSTTSASQPFPTTKQGLSEWRDARGESGKGSSGPKLPTNSKAARKRPEPQVRVPDGPPPEKVVVKDLIKGSGAPLEGEVGFEANYVAVRYGSGRERENSWELGEPSLFNFGRKEIREGWEIGLKGMKVGGRRELIVPSRLAYEDGAIVYVLDLLRIQ